MPDISIQSIQFSPDAIEVSYSESRDLHEASGILEIRTRLIPLHHVERQLNEVLEAVQELIDQSNIVQRNPPQQIKR